LITHPLSPQYFSDDLNVSVEDQGCGAWVRRVKSDGLSIEGLYGY